MATRHDSDQYTRRGLELQSALERRVAADPEWRAGIDWGSPRSGHPEGKVEAHVVDVLANVEQEALDREDLARLRFVTLVHDSFKHKVDTTKPRSGANNHATIARRFAECYTDDVEVLEVIELHDEAYNAWSKGQRSGNWGAAEARARALIARLGDSVEFYLRFYRSDNATDGKDQAPLKWFEKLVEGLP